MATESRNNVQLSLKNLYRLLTAKDYPVYSTGILRRKNKKGLTLVRFWDEYLLYEWRNTVHGRLIWRTSGSRNRYHSEICNRRADFPLYEVYIQEVLDGLTAENFGKQLRLFHLVSVLSRQSAVYSDPALQPPENSKNHTED